VRTIIIPKETSRPSISASSKEDEILAKQESIVLSERDYDRFVSLMTADTEPTDTAKCESAKFKEGQVDGVRYR
jgi:uncharacterized protein (DUF1778 family)